MKFRKPYDPPKKSPVNTGPSPHVQQHFKRECDINHIMAKYQKTGIVNHVATHQGDYSDLTDVPTYQDALNKVISANNAFSTLPSSVRKRFNNDPAQFLNFVSDVNNRSEMEEMGLIPTAPPDPSPTDPDPVADPPPSEPVQ